MSKVGITRFNITDEVRGSAAASRPPLQPPAEVVVAVIMVQELDSLVWELTAKLRSELEVVLRGQVRDLVEAVMRIMVAGSGPGQP
ncbi:MAG: hypothetical protein Q8O40_13325 [Chloroflexota bacterium]|nr:hypothetical protein [Chloroflexota bacterium]